MGSEMCIRDSSRTLVLEHLSEVLLVGPSLLELDLLLLYDDRLGAGDLVTVAEQHLLILLLVQLTLNAAQRQLAHSFRLH